GALARRAVAGHSLSAAGAAVCRRHQDHGGAGRRDPQSRCSELLDVLPRNLRCGVPGTVLVDLRAPGGRMPQLAVPILCICAARRFAVSFYLVFFVAPLQYGYTADGRLNGSSLFFNQKIFYWHVANAFWLFGSVFVAGTSSAIYLKTRNARWDDIASG